MDVASHRISLMIFWWKMILSICAPGKADVIFVRLVEVAGYVQKEESSIRRLMALCVWIWIVLCYEF